jgi:hypothetical protein
VAVAAATAAGLVATSVSLASFGAGWQARDAWTMAQVAEARRREGAAEEALVIVNQAGSAVPAAVLTRALALGQLGRFADAAAALAGLPTDARVLVARGEVRRLAGDTAGAARLWATREVVSDPPLDWAWRHVNAAATHIMVGDGLDMGLVRGMHAPEQEGTRRYRWSDGHAEFRLQVPTPGRYRLVADVRGYRPAYIGAPLGSIVVDGVEVGRFPLTTDWQRLDMSVQCVRISCLVAIVSNTFVPGYADPRALGIMVDTVALLGTDQE